MGCQQSIQEYAHVDVADPMQMNTGRNDSLTDKKEAVTKNITPTVSNCQNFSMKQTGHAIERLVHFLNPRRQRSSNASLQFSFTTPDAGSQAQDESAESPKDVVEEAVNSILCPVCLDVYDAPIILPCGHSLCIYHITRLKGKCPTCRKPFSESDLESAKNVTLSKNIERIVQIARMIDPERETLHRAEILLKKPPRPRDITVSITKPTRETLLGLFLTRREGKVYVSRMRSNSPFQDTELQPDFEILSINNKPCKHLSMQNCASIIHQSVGKVTILARRY
mmetsp:Transcript_14436/g.20346  ORF Transcript_14436/g.20346 Transcript_14436/m.20346 type:complete len:281 (+) Transcript_14436:51-893(+)